MQHAFLTLLCITLCVPYQHVKSADHPNTSHIKTCADIKTLADTFVKYCVLNEPWAADPNLYAWRPGVTNQDISLLHRISKPFQDACKKIVDTQQNVIKTAFGTDYTFATHIIFSPQLDWFCMGKQKTDSAALTILSGNMEVSAGGCYTPTIGIGELYDSMGKHWNNTKSKKINACTVLNYSDRKTRPRQTYAFYSMPTDCETASSYSCMLFLPDEQYTYFLELTNPKFSQFASFQNNFASIAQAIFDLSHDSSFWRYEQKLDGVAINRKNLAHKATMSIDLTKACFKDTVPNIYSLQKTKDFFELDFPCTCISGTINPQCRNYFNTACRMLEEEGVPQYKPDFLQNFVRKHLLSKVAPYAEDECNLPNFYLNPFGQSYLKDSDGQFIKYNSPHGENENVAYNLDTLQSAAKTYASDWKVGENMIYTETTSSIQGYKRCYCYGMLGQKKYDFNYGVKTHDQLIYYKWGLFNQTPLYIAAFCSNDKSKTSEMYKLRYCHPIAQAKEYSAKTVYDLKKGFGIFLHHTSTLLNFEVHTDKEAAEQFITLLKGMRTVDGSTDIPQAITRYKEPYNTADMFSCTQAEIAQELGLSTTPGGLCFKRDGNLITPIRVLSEKPENADTLEKIVTPGAQKFFVIRSNTSLQLEEQDELHYGTAFDAIGRPDLYRIALTKPGTDFYTTALFTHHPTEKTGLDLKEHAAYTATQHIYQTQIASVFLNSAHKHIPYIMSTPKDVYVTGMLHLLDSASYRCCHGWQKDLTEVDIYHLKVDAQTPETPGTLAVLSVGDACYPAQKDTVTRFSSRWSFIPEADETIEDTDYLDAYWEEKFFISTHNKNTRASKLYLIARNSEKPLHSKSSSHLTYWNMFTDHISSALEKSTSVCIEAPPLMIQQFMQQLRKIPHKQLMLPSQSGNESIIDACNKLDPLSVALLQHNRRNLSVEPKRLLEYVEYGRRYLAHGMDQIQLNLREYTLEEKGLIFLINVLSTALLLPSHRRSYEVFPFIAVPPLHNAIVGRSTSLVWPSRIAVQCAYTYYLGETISKKITLGLFPQIGLASLPIALLALHIFAVNESSPLHWQMQFKDLYNSWFARLYRLQHKIGSLFTKASSTT